MYHHYTVTVPPLHDHHVRDIEGWLPTDTAARREIFSNYMGLFPQEVQNLHEPRRVDLEWDEGTITVPSL